MATNFGMSQLIGKQLAVVGDMRLGSKCDKDLLAEHVLKLSGRGLFTIDRKHKTHWTGPLSCKLWLISNEMPKLKDVSGALASRMITYRTRSSFYGREDRHLFQNKIRPELPAILLWALAYRDPALPVEFWNACLATDPTSNSRSPASLRAPNGVLEDSFYQATGRPLWNAANIYSPTLVIGGDYDTWSYLEDRQGLVRDLVHAAVKKNVVIPDATHFVLFENKRFAFFEEVLKFLRD